uniref:Uncharacterized protein n=1 Tax=Cyprinus carpio TaxID=7962 RepID=A0A8C1RIW2_CYPCA
MSKDSCSMININLFQHICTCKSACLNLGKKISVPQDLMMEELNLLSNRGSIMFTVENIAQRQLSVRHLTNAMQGEKGSDCFTSEIYINQPGRNSLVTTLKHTVAKNGIPSVLAPGYGGPLKEVPPEKFNVTVIPKSYQSPWEEKPIDNETLLASINTHLPEPPYKLTPANYKCFNRY